VDLTALWTAFLVDVGVDVVPGVISEVEKAPCSTSAITYNQTATYDNGRPVYLLASLSPAEERSIEGAFLKSYNAVARSYCDPIFRTVTIVNLKVTEVILDGNFVNEYFFAFDISLTRRGGDDNKPLFDDLDETLRGRRNLATKHLQRKGRRLQTNNGTCYCTLDPIQESAPTKDDFNIEFAETLQRLNREGLLPELTSVRPSESPSTQPSLSSMPSDQPSTTPSTVPCLPFDLIGGLLLVFRGSSLTFDSSSAILEGLILATYNELSNVLLGGDRLLDQVDFTVPVPVFGSTEKDEDGLDVPVFSIVATVNGTCNSCNPNSTLLGRYLRNCSTSSSFENIDIFVPDTDCSDNTTLIENSQSESLEGNCDSNGPHVTDFSNLLLSNFEKSTLADNATLTSVSELEELPCPARTPFNTTVRKCMCMWSSGVMWLLCGCCVRYILYQA
jgi:hypothetical protein